MEGTSPRRSQITLLGISDLSSFGISEVILIEIFEVSARGVSAVSLLGILELIGNPERNNINI